MANRRDRRGERLTGRRGWRGPRGWQWWQSLTVRITVLATVATSVVLVVVLAGVVAVFSRQLDASVDDGLRTRLGYLTEAIGDAGAAAVISESFAELFDHGRVAAASATVSAAASPLVDPAGISCPGAAAFSRRTAQLTPQTEPTHLRVLADCLPDGRVVAVAVSVQPQEEARERLLLLLALALPILVAVVALTVGRAVHGALRRVDVLTRQAAQITDGSHIAAPWRAIRGNDEIARLAMTFETMLTHLAVAFDREQAFVDEASHELRTPIAVLRGEVELALSDLADSAGVEQSLRGALAEAERLSYLVENLLGLARDRTAVARGPAQRTNLGDTVQATCQRLARSSPVDLTVEATPDLQVGLSAANVERIVSNALSNAVAAGASRVLVLAGPAQGGSRLEVHDDGPGFPAAFLPSAFERFSRADQARTRTTGAGLGLALVQRLAVEAGGTVSADNASQLGGAAIRLWFPAATGS